MRSCYIFKERLSIQEVLEKYNPNIVCISVQTHAVPFAKSLSIEAKKRNCIVVWGGIYVSYNADSLINNESCIDYCIVGDGELILPVLINTIIRKKSYSKRVLTYKDIDFYNYEHFNPDFSIIPRDIIKNHNLRSTMEMSKGCSYNCEYCCTKNLKCLDIKKTYENLYAELNNIKIYGFQKTIICDNIFLPNNQTFDEFLRIKNEIYPELRFRITVRLDLINTDLLQKCEKLGVDEIIIGIEHIDKSILLSMQKTNQPENWESLAKNKVLEIANMGILVHPIFMFGWPGETEESIYKNTEMACYLGKNQNVEPFVSFITPHPGSRTEEFINNSQLLLITSDLSKFIHLYPVSIPKTLGIENLGLLVEAHNKIRIESSMTYRNPCFSVDFVNEYSNYLR